MGKAVLVLDKMPEMCNNCELAFTDDCAGRIECLLTHDVYEWDDEAPRPNWCPLHEFNCHASEEDLERSINEILGTNYGEAQCHESTMRIAEEALRIVYKLVEDET